MCCLYLLETFPLPEARGCFFSHHLWASPKRGSLWGIWPLPQENGRFVTAPMQGWETAFPAPASSQVHIFRYNSSNQLKLTWIFSMKGELCGKGTLLVPLYGAEVEGGGWCAQMSLGFSELWIFPCKNTRNCSVPISVNQQSQVLFSSCIFLYAYI